MYMARKIECATRLAISSITHCSRHGKLLVKTNVKYFTPKQWSFYSSDLSPPDYFLNGYIKNIVIESHSFRLLEKSDYRWGKESFLKLIINIFKVWTYPYLMINLAKSYFKANYLCQETWILSRQYWIIFLLKLWNEIIKRYYKAIKECWRIRFWSKVHHGPKVASHGSWGCKIHVLLWSVP